MKLFIEFSPAYIDKVKRASTNREIDDIGSWPDCKVIFQNNAAVFEAEPDICFEWMLHLLSSLEHTGGPYEEDIWGIPYDIDFKESRLSISDRNGEVVFCLKISRKGLITLFKKALKKAKEDLEEANPKLVGNSIWEYYLEDANE